jgi:hypothetical protein
MKGRGVPADPGAVGSGQPHTSPHPGASTGHANEDQRMSKGMDRKKEEKKKPAKTMKEKKAEKREKKAGKGFAPT